MSDFFSSDSQNGFSMKVWRGERMCLLAFDVDQPEADFVGFAIEVKRPGASTFTALRNRLAFSYPQPAATAVNGDKQFPSLKAPFQKFRWVHFPQQPQPGTYKYRATKMHMPVDGDPQPGTSIELPISLDPITYANFLDIGFTRNFASSQAYREQFGNDPGVIPADGEEALTFQKEPAKVYEWLGFEAYDLLFSFLNQAVNDATIELDVFAYDLDEPDIVGLLKQLGPRLRIIIDNSIQKNKSGVKKGHGLDSSDESKAAGMLTGAQVKRAHFEGLQHHKVLIAKRNGGRVQGARRVDQLQLPRLVHSGEQHAGLRRSGRRRAVQPGVQRGVLEHVRLQVQGTGQEVARDRARRSAERARGFCAAQQCEPVVESGRGSD